MIFPDTVRLIYLIVSFILVGVLTGLIIFVSKKTFKLKYYVMNPLIVAIYSIIMYCLFLISKDYKLAVLFDSLFFIGTDWLAMFMMFFAIYYTEQDDEKVHTIKIVAVFFVIVDTISLLLNNFRFHMFRLVEMESPLGIGSYWGNDFYFLHYCHLFICYVMVVVCIVCLVVAIFRCNEIYKIKYYAVLIAYTVVIVVNYLCYTINLPLDFSVVLYGVLGGFVCYYATTGFPKKLIYESILLVNDTISDAVIYFDYYGKCIYANKKAKEIFSNDGEFISDLTETYRDRWADQLGSTERSIQGTDSFYDDGKETFYDIVYQREYNKDSEIGASLKLIDKTDEILSYERERKIAIHDPLTGIYNRIGFFEAVDEIVQSEGNDDWMMLSSNIRDFQLINEYFGEERGDEVLRRQAAICQTNSHPGTVYGRIGDDKLALYTKTQYFNEEVFVKFVAQMAELTDCPYYKMKVAIGIYEPKGKVESAQVMYDKALLASVYNDDEYDRVFSRYNAGLMGKIFSDKRLSDSLEDALKNKEIEMYLQPIMNKKGDCVGAEALSRWRSSHYGDMMPAQFISVLEKTGQIYLLDAYIWEQAAKLLQKWKLEGKTKNFITVNISIKDFFYTDLYKSFKDLITKYDIDPENLHVEITETVLMSDFTKVYSLVENLRSDGISVAIDNFGNGYSSLNMMKDFNADSIKIDMELLKNITTEERGRIVLGNIIEMCKKLGMAPVGSGVETKEQYNVLKKCNCEYFQGNFLSVPLSVSDFEIKYNN